MKRVLLTVHKFFPAHKAGTEVLTLKVAQELQRRGYDTLVVTADPPDLDARHPVGPESKDFEYEGVPVHCLGESLRLQGYTFRHEYYHPAIKEHFAAIVRSFAPDLLHTFHCQNLSAGVIEAAGDEGVPVVCSTTDFWFVCPVVQLKRPDGSVCRGPGPGALKCLTCYTPKLFPPSAEFVEAASEKYPAAAGALRSLPEPVAAIAWKALYTAYAAGKVPSAAAATVSRPEVLRRFANSARGIMVPTRLMRDIFVENGIRPEIIHHVPFGLDTEPLLRHRVKRESAELRIGFIGTLFEHKGVDLLLEAFQRLPKDAPARLTIYGDVEQFPDYGRMLLEIASRSQSHRSKITFAGTFPNTRLGEVLQELDVLVVPSRWYENTPLVIQSALATKTPVVATDLGGMSELVRHQVNGLLFRLNDAESLKAQLERLVNDRGLLRSLTDSIPPERTTAEMVDDIEGVYEKALRHGQAQGHAASVVR